MGKDKMECRDELTWLREQIYAYLANDGSDGGRFDAMELARIRTALRAACAPPTEHHTTKPDDVARFMAFVETVASDGDWEYGDDRDAAGRMSDDAKAFLALVATAVPPMLSGFYEPSAPHPDDLAVDRFAAAMKAKLAASRVKGRGGWENTEVCPPGSLQQMLLEHLEKGDPVDVGNFAMMIFNRGEQTHVALPVAMPVEASDVPARGDETRPGHNGGLSQ
jgi:hypothetical protein